jgi:hypothetical protein
MVVNGKAEAERTFSGDEFDNVTSGNIIWDGLNDEGRVVDDGQYQIKVVDATANNLGSLLVVVDNNRSLFADAIGTKYMMTVNFNSLLPYINGDYRYGSWFNWSWFPDESGILMDYPGDSTYSEGLYFASIDGNEIIRLFQIVASAFLAGRRCFENAFTLLKIL